MSGQEQAETTLPTTSCTVCGIRVRLTVKLERVAELRAEAEDAPLATVLDWEMRRVLSIGGWVLWAGGDHATREDTCPDCVEAQKVERAKATCPPWCITNHAAEKITCSEWTFGHAAPVGEVLNGGRWDDGPIWLELASCGWEVGEQTPADAVAADLRTMASELIAAAEWLEVL